MRLTVNGKEIDVEHEMSISEFLHARGLPEALVAVEHNLEWAAREQWPHLTLKEGDRLEVVRAVAGG